MGEGKLRQIPPFSYTPKDQNEQGESDCTQHQKGAYVTNNTKINNTTKQTKQGTCNAKSLYLSLEMVSHPDTCFVTHVSDSSCRLGKGVEAEGQGDVNHVDLLVGIG